MMNMVKRVKVFPVDWLKVTVQTILKKKNGSSKDLDDYRDIYLKLDF